MAEASISGGEASEEEDSYYYDLASYPGPEADYDFDEAFPSDYDSDEASPSDGEITAASQRPPRHTNKRKKLCYGQDYLQRTPKHQRKRIKKEIDKSYKPGETAALHTATKLMLFPTLLIEWLLINRPRV